MSNTAEILFLFPQRLHSPLLAKIHFLSVLPLQKVSDFQSTDHILRKRNHPLMHSELDCLLSCCQSATVPVATHVAIQLEKKHWENIYSLDVLKQNYLPENNQNKPVFQSGRS